MSKASEFRIIPLHLEPQRMGFDSDLFLSSLDRLFTEALMARTFSGASLLVARPDLILFHKTWGQTQHGGCAVDARTLFDLASLTKPLVTAPLCMHAVSQGKFALDDTLSLFFSRNLLPPEKKAITIRQLLSHSSGLPAYEPFYRELIFIEAPRRQVALLEKVLRAPLVSEPGTSTCYSDLGFMLLCMILEVVYGSPIDHVASQFLPNGTLGFCRLLVPTDPTLPPERLAATGSVFAATEDCPWRKRLLAGEVHDENAYCLGGVAGHAGLFGTAHGVFELLAFLWKVYRGIVRDGLWTPEVVQEFWTRHSAAPEATWMLGYDTPSLENSSAGNHFSPRSLGHLGFTGTSFWFDLDQEILIVLLTNRVYPTRENERLKRFRPAVHNLVMETYDGTPKS
jgi:serine-type D-Ala-D-Ala carboxypeptidase